MKRPKHFFADLMHQYGEGGVNKNQFLRYGKDLDSIYKASLTGEYNQRRTGVYNDLKKINISPEKVESENMVKKEPINTRPDPDALMKKISDGINNLVEHTKTASKADNKSEVSNSATPPLNIVAVPKNIMTMVFGLNAGGESNNFGLA